MKKVSKSIGYKINKELAHLNRHPKHVLKHLLNTFKKEFKHILLLSSIKHSKFNDIKCHVPKSTSFAHYGIGVVINPYTKLGENVYIRQNVTIGTRYSTGDAPIIEDNVTIHSNATILGDIVIGRGSTIAAGSVVLNDVPPYSLVAGNPAQVKKALQSETSNDSTMVKQERQVSLKSLTIERENS